MPLVKEVLSQSISGILKKQAAKNKPTDTIEVSQKEFADELASVIDAYIKTATVTIPALPVVGIVAGPGIGTLS